MGLTTRVFMMCLHMYAATALNVQRLDPGMTLSINNEEVNFYPDMALNNEDGEKGPHPISCQGGQGGKCFHMVHIPKVAGDSMLEDMKTYLQAPYGVGLSSRQDCLSHFKAASKPGDTVVVLLRNPVSHVYSEFLECADDSWGRKASRGQVTDVHAWLQHFSKDADLSITAQNDFGCIHPSNLQTRVVGCNAANSHNCNHMLDYNYSQALNYITADDNVIVGLLEHYQVSTCLWAESIKGELPAYCNCADKPAWSKFQSVHLTHGVRKHSVKDLTPEDLAAIEKLTKDDTKLYEAGKKDFYARVSKIEQKHNTKLLCE